MVEIIEVVDIEAPPEAVWAVMSDVTRWKDWTPSIRDVRAMDEGEPAPGKRYRVLQPKLPPAVWTIDVWEPPRRFRWRVASPGLLAEGVHSVSPTATGSRVELVLRNSGVLGSLVGRMLRRLSVEYVAMEAAGLKRRCEASAPRSTPP